MFFFSVVFVCFCFHICYSCVVKSERGQEWVNFQSCFDDF